MPAKIPTVSHRFPRASVVLALIVIACLLGGLMGCSKMNDADTELRHSNLIVYTDPLSGCQYLKPAGYSGLAPRMDASGKQVCLLGAKAGGVL